MDICNTSNTSLHIYMYILINRHYRVYILFAFADKCEVYYEQSYQGEKHSGHYHALKITTYQTNIIVKLNGLYNLKCILNCGFHKHPFATTEISINLLLKFYIIRKLSFDSNRTILSIYYYLDLLNFSDLWFV